VGCGESWTCVDVVVAWTLNVRKWGIALAVWVLCVAKVVAVVAGLGE
jgi:hypothetical protein